MTRQGRQAAQVEDLFGRIEALAGSVAATQLLLWRTGRQTVDAIDTLCETRRVIDRGLTLLAQDVARLHSHLLFDLEKIGVPG